MHNTHFTFYYLKVKVTHMDNMGDYKKSIKVDLKVQNKVRF